MNERFKSDANKGAGGQILNWIRGTCMMPCQSDHNHTPSQQFFFCALFYDAVSTSHCMVGILVNHELDLIWKLLVVA
jgi:hypothetical protein